MKLPKSNITSVPKKHARIHWTTSVPITDLVVYSVPDSEMAQKLFAVHYDRQISYSDIGNCLSNWEHWELSDVLLKLFGYGFENREVLWKAMTELSKIREFRERIMDHYHFAIPESLKEQYEDEQKLVWGNNE